MNKKNKRQTRTRREKRQVKLDPRGVALPIDEILRWSENNGANSALESEVYEFVLAMHPDFKAYVQSGKPLPEEVAGPDGDSWSPALHLSMHAVIEGQLLQNDPIGVLDLALEFEAQEKIDAHEIRHSMMDVFAQHLWSMQAEGKPFDHEAYLAELPASFQLYCG